MCSSDLDHNHTHYMLKGGRGSTKSSFIAIIIPLLLIQNPDTHAVCMRKVGETLKDSVYANIQWGIDQLGLGHLFHCTVKPLEITYIPTGQKILFRGLDKKEKIKGEERMKIKKEKKKGKKKRKRKKGKNAKKRESFFFQAEDGIRERVM